ILGYRKELVDFVLGAGVPTVVITQVNDRFAFPRVEGDNVRIGQIAAEHFLERGYRHFAWAPFVNDVMDVDRYKGFSKTLSQQGFSCHVLPLAYHLVGRRLVDNWAERRRRLIGELKKLPHPCGVFCYNDCIAADTIDACRDANLLVPEQIAVLGVDNDPDVCDCAPVSLSSVIHDLEGMAYESAALLDRLMNGHKPPKHVLRVEPKGIITRVSTDIRAVSNVNVAIALRFISEYYHNPLLAVSEVAAATSLSLRQLERVFPAEMHCSVHEYIVDARLH